MASPQSTLLVEQPGCPTRQPIITIDGPAGAGKSTIAQRVATTLGLRYLDTGAMYRAMTWFVLQSNGLATLERDLTQIIQEFQLNLVYGNVPQDRVQVWVNGQNVTQAIRSTEVSKAVPTIAAQPLVRQVLVKQQQACGREGGIVVEGRDIGTNVFPTAELKIFLTASVQERARRRYQELHRQGTPTMSLDQLEALIHQRDWQDSTRALDPLKKATDAIEIQTDHLSLTEVERLVIELYRARLTALAHRQPCNKQPCNKQPCNKQAGTA